MSTVNLNRLADWRWQDNTYNDISGVGDNTAVTGHAKADDLIVCMTVRGAADACNKGSAAAVVKVQVSKDSGSYVDIASGSGDVRCVADTITGFTDHGTCVQKAANTLSAVCGTGFAGHSTQLNGDATAPSITVSSETWTEVQLLLDFTNAAAGSTYEFRVYNVTLGTAFAPDAVYGQGYPSVTIASAVQQTADYSDTHLSGDWTEVFAFAFGTTVTDNLSSAWTEVFAFGFGTTIADTHLSSDWDEVFILGSSAFISDSLTFKGDVFYGGTDYAILAQDGDWIATQAGETIEYQYEPPAQTATPSDNLSGDWDEVFAFAFGTTVEDNLSGDWDEVFAFVFGTTIEDDLSTAWTEVFEFDFGTTITDNLSSAWTEVFEFDSEAVREDDLSGDWTEVFTFAFGTTVEDDLSTAWTDEFTFIVTASVSDNLSGEWDEAFAFAFGTTVEDDLSGDWDEVFAFDFGTTVEDDLSTAWTEVFAFASEAVCEDDLSGDWTEVFAFAFGTTIEDDLSGAWTELFEFDSEAVREDDLSGDWTEVFVFSFGTTIEDDLSIAWDEDFNFGQQTAEPSDDLSGDWTELFEFDSEAIREDDLSGDWTEVFAFSFGTSFSDNLSGDWTEVFAFTFGTTIEESITLDEELVADITGGADPAVLQDTLTFSEVMDIGEIDPNAILAQDGDVLLAQDGDQILEQIEEVFLRAQDGDDIQTQAGDEILLQTSGAEQADSLTFAEVLVVLQTYIEEIDEPITFSELLSTVAVTDDLLINESITLSEQLVTNILLRPVKSQAPELIIGADGTYLEAQYTEADTSHTFETFTLADQLDTLIGRYAPVSDTLNLIDLITGVPAGALTPSDSLVLAEDLAADIGRLLTVNESFSFTELFEFKFKIEDSLVFRDYISTADEYQYLWDGVYFSEDLYATLSEYTGAVFWFGEWIQLFVSLISELEDALDLDDEIIGTGQYGLLLDTLQAATEEDRVTPWTEEDGTTLAEEHGSVDLYFTESLTYGTLTSSTAEEFRFVDNFYLQEYAMPCPPATGPCTTEVTGSCAAPKTLSTSAGSVPSDFAVTGSLFYLSFSWTPFASGSLRIFFRKKLTEEKWSTILVDGVDGSVETPNELDIGDYEGGVRYEDDSYYSVWTPFEFELPEYEDSVTLTETLALLAARKRTRVDTIAFEETLALV